MKKIDLVKLKADIALRKSMPDFGPETSIKRLRIVNDTRGSFTPEVVEALIERLEAAQRERDEMTHKDYLTWHAAACKFRAERDEAINSHRHHAARLIDERGQLRQRAEAAEAELKRLNEQKPVAWINTRHGDPTWPRVYVSKDKADENRKLVDLAPMVNTSPLYTAAHAAVPEKVVQPPATSCIGWVRDTIHEHDEKWKQALDAAGVKWVEGE